MPIITDWQSQLFVDLQGPKLSRLQSQLQSCCSRQLQLKINDNRSTMLSVRWEPSCTKVSLHHMFLSAPNTVIKALACSIAKEQTSVAPQVKAFIQENLQRLDSSQKLDPDELIYKGNVYNLKEIYDGLNAEYFDDDLNLNITWFGQLKKKNRSQVTFGLYHDALRLIKIHRIMDSPSFPEYVVSFVIYHEMLHHVCPPYIDENGIQRIHNEDFKYYEMQFKEFKRAKNWVEKHRLSFFR
ncbi:MAG: hypothetical protein ACXWM7_04965 [Parachlamydiaceae bacterium]